MQQILNLMCEHSGQRLDVFVHAALALQGHATSRTEVQRWIKDGFVLRTAPAPSSISANPAKKVQMGEAYTVNVPAAVESALVAEDIPLEVVFEDEHLIVINKPTGFTVHPAPGNWTGTLVQALLHHCKGSLSGINGEERPGIVHRIDKDTSGLMVAAKTDVAHRHLARQFAKHTIKREYVALVVGEIQPPNGTLVGNIGRHPVHRLRRAVVEAGSGKPAITHYQTLQNFGGAQIGASLVKCTLETGRTHQIRVHLSHKGHALLNDPLYGSRLPEHNFKGKLTPLQKQTLDDALKNLRGQALHAQTLGFVHPASGEELEFSSPLPSALQGVVDVLDGL